MNEIQMARLLVKEQLLNEWPKNRCPCGEWGATDLGHIAYTRHPDSVHLYHRYNTAMMHNKCNTTGEALWINVNACLLLLRRAGSPAVWTEWAMDLPRKGKFWIPAKMEIAMRAWDKGIRPFDFIKIMDFLSEE